MSVGTAHIHANAAVTTKVSLLSNGGKQLFGKNIDTF